MPTSKIEVKELSVGKEIKITTGNGKEYFINVHDGGDTVEIQCGFGEKLMMYPQSQDSIRLYSEF